MGRCNRGRGKAGAAKRRWQARPVLASVPGATAAQKRCGCDATVAQTVPWRDAARHPRRKQAAAQHGGGRGTGGAKSRAHVAQLGKTSTNASKPFPAGRKPLGLAEAHESHKLEKLCRYITRPAISEQRLSISPQGRVRYQLKTPWRNGTTHVEWDAVDFIAKLAALVPPPRAHLTRFHGVFAPNANLRAQVTPSGRGRRPAGDAAPVDASAHDEPRSPEQKRRAMSWAQRLKRVFSIDVTTCAHCGGAVRIVASIEDPKAIRAILAHFEKHGALEQAHYRPAARAPPPAA